MANELAQTLPELFGVQSALRQDLRLYPQVRLQIVEPDRIGPVVRRAARVAAYRRRTVAVQAFEPAQGGQRDVVAKRGVDLLGA
ncbi:hypothetical protein [Pandoraea morbifera]|uniref:hypothetical protein n=1 Tax=Pandoraea morbifera TaxID=2508300 RepID=UPI003CCDEB2B